MKKLTKSVVVLMILRNKPMNRHNQTLKAFNPIHIITFNNPMTKPTTFLAYLPYILLILPIRTSPHPIPNLLMLLHHLINPFPQQVNIIPSFLDVRPGL